MMNRNILIISLSIFPCLALHAQTEKTPISPAPKSPEAGLQSLTVIEGFKVELVAAEPLVKDPIAFDWGSDGKLWVVEMADYPLGMDGKGSFGGRVRFLEDVDGDGKYENSTLFLDKIGFPTSVMAWKKGVIVTCAPDVFYAADTNGDGKADVKKTLFTGFREGNQQHRLNGLRWGLDNWVYAANGDSGGDILSVKTKTKLKLGRRDLRFRPESGEIEAVSGQTQFGRVRDDWGNWFGCSNSQPAYHYALVDHYLRRNKFLSSPNVKVQISNQPGAATIFPRSRTLARFNDLNKVNRFTSACGIEIYRDNLLGKQFRGNTFVCEPVHNLVHREVVSPRGTTFSSQRSEDEKHREFLASTDNWFRPTLARTGPDGALWISDMYRAVIEHPQWITKEFLKNNDVRAGEAKGRIYRIVPVNVKLRAIPRLDKLKTAQLVELLESPNGTLRDMVHQTLLEQKNHQAVTLLRQKAMTGQHATARLHALCLLDGLHALTPEIVQQVFRDKHPGVRRHAIRLSEPFMQHSNDFELPARLLNDKDPQVQIQLAYSLGTSPRKNRGELLAKLLQHHPDDIYLQTAVMSSLDGHLATFTKSLLQHDTKQPLPKNLTSVLVNMIVASQNDIALQEICQAISHRPKENMAFNSWQKNALSLLLDALSRRNQTLRHLQKTGSQPVRQAVEDLRPLFVEARRVATAKLVDLTSRQQAILLLGHGFDHRDADIITLTELLEPRNSQQLQKSAMRALAKFSDQKISTELISRWKSYGPQLKSELFDLLFRRSLWLEELLNAIEQKNIPLSELDATHRQLLQHHQNPKIRQRATKLFAFNVKTKRTDVIIRYMGSLKLQGDTTKGHQTFKKQCAVCHRLNNEGHAIGPDLSALTDKSPEAMLVSILDPNRATERKFVSYIAATLDGLTFTGILAAESGNSITLLQNEGKKKTLLRSDLDEFQSTGKSLMPEGLEKDLSLQDIANIIAYVNSSGSPRKQFAGNQPAVVKPEALRGEYWLIPQNAEVYGSTVVYENRYQNLGFWKSENDHAVWTLHVPQKGRFDIYMEYACPQNSAGNIAAIEVAGKRMTWQVKSTESWNKYLNHKMGTITLQPGKVRLGVRSIGQVKNALFDLKAVRLRPVK